MTLRVRKEQKLSIIILNYLLDFSGKGLDHIVLQMLNKTRMPLDYLAEAYIKPIQDF